MIRQARWIFFPIVILAFAAMACGLFSGDEETAARSGEQPGEGSAVVEEGSVQEDSSEAGAEREVPEQSESGSVAEVEATGVPEQPVIESTEPPADEGAASDALVADVLGHFDPASLTEQVEFDSYRFTLFMEFGGTDDSGNEQSQNVEAEMAVVTDPPAMELTMGIEGVQDAEDLGEIAITVIDDTTYMIVPGFGCVSSDVANGSPFAENPFADLLNPTELFDELQTADYVGEEVVNGTSTLVFEFDETFLSAAEDVEWADGRIFIAKERNYLVRLVMEGEGNLGIIESSTEGSGTFYIELNITDVNEAVEVGIPAGCEESTPTTVNLPMLEDAYEASTFDGSLSYKSNATIEEALEYYELALSVDGWINNEAESLTVPGMAIVHYDKDANTITLTINDDEESGGILVLIVTEEGG